jgi:hypothetical protein
MLALRSADGVVAVDVEDTHVVPADPALESPDRWVSIDEIGVAEGELAPDLWIAVEDDRWRGPSLPGKGADLPAVTVLAPDESLWVRARRRGSGAVVAEAPLRLQGLITIDLIAPDGVHVAKVNARVRVRPRYPEP